jgi:hypothetical protein
MLINGKIQNTIVDAAKQFGVSPKTVYSWIEKGIIPRPPTVKYGIRTMQVFPSQYMKDAKRRIQDQPKEKLSNN